MGKKKKETLGDRVERLLGGHRGGRAAMCRDLKLHPNTLANWFKPDYAPKIDNMYKVAQYLNVSLEYLWTGEYKGEVHDIEDEIFLRQYLSLSEADKKGVRLLVKGLLDYPLKVPSSQKSSQKE